MSQPLYKAKRLMGSSTRSMAHRSLRVVYTSHHSRGLGLRNRTRRRQISHNGKHASGAISAYYYSRKKYAAFSRKQAPGITRAEALQPSDPLLDAA